MRVISDDFIEALRSGLLRPVTEAVLNRANSLILCVRDGYVNVYYKSHSLLKISEHRKGYRLSFNLRHGRYTAPMEELTQKILRFCPAMTVTRSGEAWFYAEERMASYLSDLITFYKQLIDDFFNPALTADYIKPSVKRDLLEKVRQQELYMKHMEAAGVGEELVFYDMELSIPNENRMAPKKGSPDCLAVKLHDGLVTEIVLVEVKSNVAACEGSHGVKKHADDFDAIISNESDRAWLYESMRASFECFHALGMYKGVKNICALSECTFSKLFFFTDGAVDWAKRDSQRDDYMIYN